MSKPLKTVMLSTVILLGISPTSYATTVQYTSTPLAQYSNAVPIDSGTQYDGQLTSKSQENYYMVTTQKDGQIYVTFSNITAPVEAQILDQSGKQISYVSSFSNTTKQMQANVQQGRYYIRVRSYQWKDNVNNGTYSIQAAYASPESTQGSNNTQANQTIENALSVTSGQSNHAKLVNNVDVDYYKLVSKDQGDLYTRFENINAPLDIQLLDSSGNLVKEIQTDSAKNKVLEANIQQDTYYIKVSHQGGGNDSSTTASYDLIATFPTINVTHVDNFEPNDTVNSAYRIHSNMQYTKTLTTNVDRDAYKIVVNQDGPININFSAIGNPITSTLLDQNGNLVTQLDTKSVSTISLTKGTYYIMVSAIGWDDNETGSYTVQATFPEDNNISVNVNGVSLSFDQPPVVDNGRTLVPLRSILGSLGATVDWNATTQTVIATQDDLKVEIPVNSNVATVNGKQVALDVPAQIINERTMIPIRFLSEALNANVQWDKENQVINIKTPIKIQKKDMTLPSLTISGVTVDVTKVNRMANQTALAVTIHNDSGIPVQLSQIKVNTVSDGTPFSFTFNAQDSGFIDPNLLNILSGSTEMGTITLPTTIDGLTTSFNVELDIKHMSGVEPTDAFLLDIPIQN